jgi:phage tail sheath protein FI
MAESIISPGVFTRENDISFIQPAPIAAGAAFLGPTVKGPVEIPTVVTSYNDYVRRFGDVFQSGSDNHEFFTSMAVRSYFSQGGQTALITRIVSGTYSEASSSVFNSTATASFTLETIGKGVIYNNSGSLNADGSLISGSSDNVRWEVSNVNNNLGTFSLLIRRGDDSANNKVILETFANVSLDPNSDNYIEKIIGTQKLTVVNNGEYLQTAGSFPNASNYVRVKSVNLPTLNYLGNDGITVNTDALGNSYSASLPQIGSGSFSGGQGDVKAGANLYQNISAQTQGLVVGNYTTALNLLSNKDDYQFNIIAAPGLTEASHAQTVGTIIGLAEERQDCIAVVDLVGYGATVAAVTGAAAGLNTSYAASYWPWLQVRSATGKNVWVPASVTIPGVYAFTDAATAPWFAPAGLIRGGIPGVLQAERKLPKSDRDTLYSGKVNPIATFPGSGISVFGQKTLQTKASALDRVNVRRLLIELKKFIGDQARNLVFEQNTITTRNRFLAIVNPYLESVVQRQGLFAYRVVMDDTNNTADVVDRNQLVGQIFIQPAKTIEFVVLDFTIEPTGATFG